jgi:hypothetical protein
MATAPPAAAVGADATAAQGAADPGAGRAGTAAADDATMLDPSPGPDVEREVAEVAVDPDANVRVVRFGTGEPVAGAEVWSVPPDFDWQKLDPEERARQQLLVGDQEAWVRHFGRLARTDAAGGCRVECGRRGTTIVARDGDAFGRGHLRPDADGVLEIVLRPDHTLTVEVRTHDGRAAAGVTVVVESVDPPEHANVHTWHLNATDEHGAVVVRHAQTFAGDAASLPVRVVANCPGGASEPVRVDMCEPPSLVRLTLPATGVVRVRLSDATGKRLDPDGMMGTPHFAVLDEPPDDPERRRAGGVTRLHEVPVVDGAFEFRNVVFDKWVVVGRFPFFVPVSGKGPTAADPVVTFDLREQPGDAVVVGVLVGDDGQPLADQELRVDYSMARGRGGRRVQTDASGRFRCCLASLAVGDDVRLSFHVAASGSIPKRSVELPSGPVASGINDVGTVQVLAAGVLVAGRLVCEDGVEIDRAPIRIEREQDGRWRHSHGLQPEWSDGGTFCVRGDAPADASLRLIVERGAYLPVAPIPFAVGAKDVEVPLRVAGSAAATFLVDDGCPLDRLRFHLDRVGEERDGDMQRRRSRDFEGQLHHRPEDGRVGKQWHGLEPGTWSLTVAIVGREDAVVRLDGLRIGAGPCSDPRLQQIDLRGRVRTLTLRVHDERGAPIADRDAFVVVCNEGGDWRGFHLGRGEVELAATAAVDLIVSSPGHELLQLRGVSASRTVALRPAREARIRIELPASLPEGCRVGVELQPQLELPKRGRMNLDTGRGMNVESFFVERAVAVDGVCKVLVRVPGSHRVRGLLYAARGRRWRLDGAGPASVVLEGGGEAAVLVTSVGLQKSLARLGR